MRDQYLQSVWKFEDLHNPDATPSFIHRLRDTQIKHMGTVGEKIILVNNNEDNVDVFGSDQP
jgi:hypothetical protein